MDLSSMTRSNGPDDRRTAFSGCIRTLNQAVIDLHERIKLGTRVVVARRAAVTAELWKGRPRAGLFLWRRMWTTMARPLQ